MAQYVFQKANLGFQNPIDLMYYVDLWVFAIVLPFVIVTEGIVLPKTVFEYGAYNIEFAYLHIENLIFIRTCTLDFTAYYRSVERIDLTSLDQHSNSVSDGNYKIFSYLSDI